MPSFCFSLKHKSSKPNDILTKKISSRLAKARQTFYKAHSSSKPRQRRICKRISTWHLQRSVEPCAKTIAAEWVLFFLGHHITRFTSSHHQVHFHMLTDMYLQNRDLKQQLPSAAHDSLQTMQMLVVKKNMFH